MKQTRLSLMAAALVRSLSAMAGFASNPSPFKQPASQRALRDIFGGNATGPSSPRNPGPGWSNRHVKRMASKRRNVKANRENQK